MPYAKKIELKIRKEKEEIEVIGKKIVELEIELRERCSRVEAFEEALKIVPQAIDGEKTKKDHPLNGIRRGSTADRARKVLREKGVPMSVNEILFDMGEEGNTKRRQAVASILSTYVRNNDIFARTEPGIFGLKEFENTGQLKVM